MVFLLNMAEFCNEIRLQLAKGPVIWGLMSFFTKLNQRNYVSLTIRALLSGTDLFLSCKPKNVCSDFNVLTRIRAYCIEKNTNTFSNNLHFTLIKEKQESHSHRMWRSGACLHPNVHSEEKNVKKFCYRLMFFSCLKFFPLWGFSFKKISVKSFKNLLLKFSRWK